jgi:hypothetical protein
MQLLHVRHVEMRKYSTAMSTDNSMPPRFCTALIQNGAKYLYGSNLRPYPTDACYCIYMHNLLTGLCKPEKHESSPWQPTTYKVVSCFL